MATGALSDEVACAGLSSYLPKEHGQEMVPLSIVRALEGLGVAAVAQWDSSVHDSIYLNRITPANERVYVVLLVRVGLCQPLPMDIVLRKRLCVHVYKQTFTNKLMRSIAMRRVDQLEATGVVYEVVSNIPKASEELEDRESLAQMAASGQEASDADGDTYIEKYLQGVSAVESILRLDRLRQSVAVRELTRDAAGPTSGASMRKTASVPNISYFQRQDPLNRSESYLELGGLSTVTDWSDATDHSLALGASKAESPGLTPSRPTFLNLTASRRLQGAMSKCRSLLSGLSGSLVALHEEAGAQDASPPPPAPHAAPTPSPGSLKLPSRMSTLHEDHDREVSPETAGASVPPAAGRGAAPRGRPPSRMRGSRTFDSLVEIPAPVKTNSPSVTSSGYGSQAVSSSNLSSEDSVSLQSIDETSDSEASVVAAGAAAAAAADGPAGRRLQPLPEVAHESHPEPQQEQERGPREQPEPQPQQEPQRETEQESPQEPEPQPRQDRQRELEQESPQEPEQKTHQESQQEPQQEAQQDPEQDSEQEPEQESEQEPQQELHQEPEQESRQEPGLHWNNLEENRLPENNGFDGAQFGLPDWVTPGEAVLVRPQSLSGWIRFVGPVQFAPGCWVGVALDMPQGKNNGSVKDVQYFHCEPKHGIFVRADKLIWDHRRSRAQKGRSTGAAAPAGRRSLARGDTSTGPAAARSRSEGLSNRK